MPVVLCDRVPCTNPYAQTCPACEERLCVSCYGTGSSTKCARCSRRLAAEQAVTEERRREDASQAASW